MEGYMATIEAAITRQQSELLYALARYESARKVHAQVTRELANAAKSLDKLLVDSGIGIERIKHSAIE